MMRCGSPNEHTDVRLIVTNRFQPNLILYLLAVAAVVLLAPYVGVHIATTRPTPHREDKPLAALKESSEAESTNSAEGDTTAEPSATSRGEGLAEIEQLLGHK